ncbi:uncharacterized protein A4U43_C03F10400 [Asparagus officinalis]|uniref:Glucose/Sorbosone dehydrogenase domain-containing protein n=1 Tax=Asparagus officinalis TaxID=4686 RepID=A0A5P1FAP6_ASPOF|nr:uncharacterized protein A4U43_C03F10400 [Asparagus officinalis]
MMKILHMVSLLFSISILFFIPNSCGLKLCTDSRAPLTLKAPLSFCGYNGSSCCSAADDSALHKQFKAMNISDSACASLVQSILCAKCDPYSADLFTATGLKLRTVPILCSSTSPSTSAQAEDSTSDFCSQVWDTCKDTSIQYSPFAPTLQGSTRIPSSKLTDLWRSKSDFCSAIAGSSDDESLCFTGKSVEFNATTDSPDPKGLCLERIGNGSYLNMAAHPDGSNRVFLANQAGQSRIDDLGLWGNYSIPKDNPYAEDSELQGEIWALGVRNPWRCSFDSKRPSYFYCADVGEDTYEEVDLISKGGNYGWNIYEGPLRFNFTSTPKLNTSAASIDAIPPIMGYTHSDLNNSVGSASITGGYVYRSMTDPCMFGRYLYADLYAGAMWAGTESPENSGNYSSKLIPFGCSKQSPIPCETVAGSSLPSLGYIYSFSEDNNKDVFLLTLKGVYRVVPPSRCNYSCPKEKISNTTNPAPGPSSSGCQLENLKLNFSLLLVIFLIAFDLV